MKNDVFVNTVDATMKKLHNINRGTENKAADAALQSKRIVSKGEYVVVQTSRFALRVSAVLSIVEVVICMVLAVYIPLLHFGLLGWLASLFCAVMAFRLGKHRLTKLRLAAALEEVLPLTKANTALLPPAKSLVRAASASPQELQDVLLRATIEPHETPADQLLCAANSDPDTDKMSAIESQILAKHEPDKAEERMLCQVTKKLDTDEDQFVRVTTGE